MSLCMMFPARQDASAAETLAALASGLAGNLEAHHSRHMRVKHTCGARQARGSREATETSLSLGSRHAAGSTVARCPCVACETALIMSVSQLHWLLVLQGRHMSLRGSLQQTHESQSGTPVAPDKPVDPVRPLRPVSPWAPVTPLAPLLPDAPVLPARQPSSCQCLSCTGN